MKKASVFLIPLLFLVVLGAVVIAKVPSEPGLPSGCQARLDEYVQAAFPTGTTALEVVQRARRPENLTRNSVYTVFGNSTFYQTDVSPRDNTQSALMPLPYPPKELWCILLRHDDPDGETSHAIVFVGLHMDMYSADWMIHEGPRDLSTPGTIESLYLVGCDLNLDQTGPDR